MKLLIDVPNLPHETKEQIKWLDNLGCSLQEQDKIRNITVMEQCRILYCVYDVWSRDEIKNETKGFWNYDFYSWAKAFTQRRGSSPANITIDNQIAVYRDYIADAIIEPPEYVFIQARDDFSQKIEGKKEKIKADFSRCDYTKLLVARGPAKRREMNEKSWAALFDPHATVKQLTVEIVNSIKPVSNEINLYEKDGIIYAHEEGLGSVPLCGIINDESQTLLWQKGLEKLFGGAKVPMPIEYSRSL